MTLRPLMPHQHDALAYANKRSSVALFMEMRLGKTIVAIRWAQRQAKHRAGRILVVAPLAVLRTWQEELIKEGETSVTLKGKCVVGGQAQFFLINYELLRARPGLFQVDWDVIILDESTKIRNPQAQITKLLLHNRDRFPARAILSGMPAPESAQDFCCQMLFLHPEFLGAQNFWQFRHRFFNLYGYDWVPRLGVLGKIRAAVHERAFVFTRKQAGIGSKKIYEKRYVEMSAAQRKQYKKIEKEFAYETKDHAEIQTKWNPVKLTWLARVAGGFNPDSLLVSDSKAREVLSLLKGELVQEQVIVWFRFNQELRHCDAVLRNEGIRSACITGETSQETRQDTVARFKEGALRVLCVQEKCGMFGVDWSCASTAIYYSNHYEAEARAQSEDRILHPAKSEPLLYIDLVTKDTVDEDVVATLQDKRITSAMFMTKFMENWRTRCASR